MVRQSRRRFVGTVAGAGAAALAGCSALLGDDGSGEASGWATWVPATFVVGESRAEVSYVDVETYRSSIPESSRSGTGFGQYERLLGLEQGGLDLYVSIGLGGRTEHAIVVGEFGPETVTQRTGVEPSTTYEGFEVLSDEIAVGDGVLIGSADYETIIDVHGGDGDDLLDADGEWPAAVDDASGAALGSLEPAANEPWELQAVSIGGDGGERIAVTVYAYFADADAAEAGVEPVRSYVTERLSVRATDYEIQNTAVDGNVVEIEGSVSEYDL